MAGAVALYGASGYTGRLVLAELGRRGLDVVVSGRSAERLHEAVEAAGVEAVVRPAALDDRGALRHAIGDCDAVVACAGPFTRLGEPVVRAAVETGTHYVDTTGEQAFMTRVLATFDDPARAAGVAVVPALGFDYAPGDLISHLAAQGAEPLAELVVAYAARGFAPSRGTVRSALEIMRGADVSYEDGDWRRAPRVAPRAAFRFPAPVGRVPVTRYPGGEVVTVPRHVRTRAVRELIATEAVVPGRALAPLLGRSMPLVRLALSTPLRLALSAAVEWLPEGPAVRDRAAVEFTVAAVARGEDGRVGRGLVRGSDVYRVTAACAAHGAAVLAAGDHDRSGVLAPAQAFDPAAFLDFLGGHGVSYEVEPPPS